MEDIASAVGDGWSLPDGEGWTLSGEGGVLCLAQVGMNVDSKGLSWGSLEDLLVGELGLD